MRPLTMESKPKERKFPLGNELYTSVNLWNGAPLVHIRHFKTVVSPFPPHKSIQIATKSGICMNEEQFRALVITLPTVISELDKVKNSIDAEEIIPSIPESSSVKTPQRASTSFEGGMYIHRAPTKLKLPVKRSRHGPPDATEPLVKKFKPGGSMTDKDDPTDIVNQAMKCITNQL